MLEHEPFIEDEVPTPQAIERRQLASAIAQRIIQEHATEIDDFEEKKEGFKSELFFMDALTDAYTDAIEPVLKAPHPGADIFVSPYRIADRISVGDWVQLNKVTQVSLTPTQQKLTFQIDSYTNFSPGVVRPEIRFENFMLMIENAKTMARELGISVAEVYASDEQYFELVRMSIPYDVYVDQSLEKPASQTVEKIAEENARYNLFLGKVKSDPKHLEIYGFVLDKEELEEQTHALKEDESLQVQKQERVDKELDRIVKRTERIWGS